MTQNRSDLFCVAFVVLDLASSVLHQEIGWEERLQNDQVTAETFFPANLTDQG